MNTDTAIFTIPASQYAAIEGRRYFPILTGAVLLTIVAGTGLFVFSGDWRYALVALIVLSAVFPAIILLAWLALLSRPNVTLLSHPQMWAFDGNVLRISIFSFDRENVVQYIHIHLEDIKKYEINQKYSVFFTHLPTLASPGNYYIIPTSLLPEGLETKLYEC